MCIAAIRGHTVDNCGYASVAVSPSVAARGCSRVAVRLMLRCGVFYHTPATVSLDMELQLQRSGCGSVTGGGCGDIAIVCGWLSCGWRGFLHGSVTGGGCAGVAVV